MLKSVRDEQRKKHLIKKDAICNQSHCQAPTHRITTSLQYSRRSTVACRCQTANLQASGEIYSACIGETEDSASGEQYGLRSNPTFLYSVAGRSHTLIQRLACILPGMLISIIAYRILIFTIMCVIKIYGNN